MFGACEELVMTLPSVIDCGGLRLVFLSCSGELLWVLLYGNTSVRHD